MYSHESILEKVRALIALSENHGATEEERDSALAMADKLMTKHAIERAMLEASAPEQRTTPTSKRVNLFTFNAEFHDSLTSLVRHLASHYRVRPVRHVRPAGDYTLVGYSEDLEYFEIVWTSVYLAFVARMVPSWSATDTEDANVYRLKEAGIKWERIATLGGFPWPDGGKLKRAYRREAARLGVEAKPHTQRHNAYRRSYAEAFVARISARTYRQQETRNQDVSATPGAAVALRDRSAFVDDLLYQLFPEFAPATPAEMQALRRKAEAERAEELARLEAMTPKQRKDWEHAQAAQEARWNREYQREQQRREAMYDSTGADAGRKAADQVDLSGGRNNVTQKSHDAIG